MLREHPAYQQRRRHHHPQEHRPHNLGLQRPVESHVLSISIVDGASDATSMRCRSAATWLCEHAYSNGLQSFRFGSSSVHRSCAEV
ncbi:hypothetical protein A0H81_06674 [Grifola frondosa]|uniref:Uncharacterized protein n=1 Tax=Grifola frondosa TaxID=5627 RepID=A0A1C7M848_GRIFR|nr:hypothetical protein A0H81_06674 [Grifola frondosa]